MMQIEAAPTILRGFNGNNELPPKLQGVMS
jgi:hypothetical protein